MMNNISSPPRMAYNIMNRNTPIYVSIVRIAFFNI
jgi:hypothetical protein